MRKLLRGLLAVIAVAMIGVSGWNLYRIATDYRSGEQLYEEAAQDFVHSCPVRVTLPEEELAELAPITVDFEALWQENEFVVGWIYCPDTVINYPIVQTENNSDFLRRGLDGKRLTAGTIFLDYRNDGAFLDDNSVIYGHNMRNNTMFGTFDQYQSPEYYLEHPVFYLLTPEADYRIDLIAGLTTDARSDFYQMHHTPETFRKFLETAVSQSTFLSDVDLNTVERTLTMSTCSYAYDDARYLLIGSITRLHRPEA